MGASRSTARLTLFKTSPIDDVLFWVTGALSLLLFSLSNLLPQTEIFVFGLAFSVALFLRRFIPERAFKWTRIVSEVLFSILLLTFLIALRSNPDAFFTASFYLVSAMMCIYALRLFSQYEAVYFLSFPLAAVLLAGSVLPLTRSFLVVTALAVASLLLLIRADWSYFTENPHPAVRTLASFFSTRLVLPIQLGVVFLSLFLYLNMENLPTLHSPFRLRSPRAAAIGEMVDVSISGNISPRFVSYSGLSPTLRLATPESVHLSDKPVLRVRSPNAGYLRAIVFPHYTGKVWKMAGTDRLSQLMLSGYGGDLAVPHTSAISQDSVYFSRIITDYEFLTDFTNVLPAPYAPDRVALTGVSTTMPQSYLVFADSALSLRLGYLPRTGFTYSVNSLVPNTGISFSDFPMPSRDLRVPPRYLALPPSLPDRTLSLARSLVADSVTPYQRVRSLTRHLRDSKRFTYSLNPPPVPPDSDVVDFFLFESRSGYCEIYAAALAVLLRAVEVPSRVIGGFMGGEYDFVTGTLVIKERDAHAWVEAFVEPWGWITVDATPEAPDAALLAASDDPSSIPEGPSASLTDRMFRSRLYYIFSLITSLWNSIWFGLKSSSQSLALPLVLALVVTLFVLRRNLAAGFHRIRGRLLTRKNPVLRVLRLVESRSRLSRAPSESLRRFFSRVASHFPAASSDLHSLRDQLEAFLYGPSRDVPLPQSVNTLARSLRFDKNAISVVKET
jgi:transglutaminase-like putative cysteine protease